MESHTQDHEIYAGVMRSKKRRAKALLDFERHDDDELGFRKNDVITVISQKVYPNKVTLEISFLNNKEIIFDCFTRTRTAGLES